MLIVHTCFLVCPKLFQFMNALPPQAQALSGLLFWLLTTWEIVFVLLVVMDSCSFLTRSISRILCLSKNSASLLKKDFNRYRIKKLVFVVSFFVISNKDALSHLVSHYRHQCSISKYTQIIRRHKSVVPDTVRNIVVQASLVMHNIYSTHGQLHPNQIPIRPRLLSICEYPPVTLCSIWLLVVRGRLFIKGLHVGNK